MLFVLVHGHAGEVQQGPGDKLGIPVLAQHKGVETAAVQAGGIAEGMAQPGRIQQGARAHYLGTGQAGQIGDFRRDQITGVGDIHKDPVEPGIHDPGNETGHLDHTVFQFVIPVEVPAQGNISHCVDDHRTVLEAGIIRGFILDPVGHERDGIVQIIAFTGKFFGIDVTEQDFVSNSHHPQGISHMGAHMANADNAYGGFFNHGRASLVWHKMNPLCHLL